MTGIERLHEIMTRLRDPEKGCPWDRVQTLQTLKPCVLEETYELLQAMDAPDDKAPYIEELGDVLLQVVFQSVMAEQEGRFTFDDVANAISDKLVRRHPHIFGDVKADDPATVLRNWEQIKQVEHKKETRHSALDGVPPALPALLKAQRTQEKAARVGFDWPDADGPADKIREELDEALEALSAAKGRDGSNSPEARARLSEEIGDLLFSVCNFARHAGVDAESALAGATGKFASRFRKVEAAAKDSGRELKGMSLAEMDGLWDGVKREGRVLKIGFAGAGKMAQGILSAMDRDTLKSVSIADSNPETAANVSRTFRVEALADAKAVFEKCDIVFLAVRPQDVPAVASSVAGSAAGRTIVSIVAGKTLARLREAFGPGPSFVRVMPNLALRAKAGMCAVCAGEGADPSAVAKVKSILSMAGTVVELEERHFDAVTALSGSGPAYFAYMEKAMAEGGERLGLDSKVARTLAEETMYGTAKFLRENGMPLDSFIAGVCTKGGTTAAGMSVLDTSQFAETVAGTLEAAAARSKELA